MAAGEDITRESRDVLADVRSVIEPGETGAQWEEIAARLADRLREHYANITAESISAQVRAFGVRSVDVKRAGKALKGAKAEDIDAAIARRKAA